ncbi:Autoinducer 2 sensor kinase/phosphatase LuxQ [Pseudobythopirellula maris]|uniref:histidine kinase n=1 Tax=Pseudobythopirellula maris TaxID=2527991 RepID=A0A5C5ZLQ2_9BACT|nr:ATP-binding protein [Pseudobythopirellula maris]TWT88329.1 Autoinducer 2 sensor kinase/phosphatase LuxQ [Pseudobythopirellula maris]
MLSFLFDTDGFPARWFCGTAWQDEPWLGWMHIIADLATAVAYTAIPVMMIFALRKTKQIPEPRLLMLFAVFILACGSVHLIEAIIFWTPVYRLSAVAKSVTAIASLGTVAVLAVRLPRLLALRSPEVLESLVRDRTQRLEDTAGRLELVLSAGAMGAWDWNLETNRIVLDEAEIELTGLSGDPVGEVGNQELDISAFFDIIHADDHEELDAALRESIDHGVPYEHSFRITTPQGVEKWIAGRGRLIVEPGEPRRLVGVNYDVTAIKQSEGELAEARRLAEAASEAKSRFLANTSHEIRTPLTAMLGCAESLVRESPDETTTETATVIKRQGELLLRILNDVLDLSKIEAGRMTLRRKTCDLRAMFEDIHSLLEPQAEAKGLALSVEVDPNATHSLRTDPVRVRQVLLNLASNAVKFTEKGSVSICAEEAAAEEGLAEGLSDGPQQDPDAEQQRWLRLRVSDTGPGIPEEHQQAVFEAFHQSDAAIGPDGASRGTGLGLTIAARLARMLGGRLDLNSRLGEGAEFTFWLPLVEATPKGGSSDKAGAARANGADSPQRRGRILVAEDTPSIQFLLRKILTPHATRLDVVGDGQAAVDAARSARDAGQPHDAILLDMTMPILGGHEAAQILRSEGFSTPIIALTAGAMVGDRERCLAAGCTEYLAKPLDWDALEAAVQTALADSEG